MFNALVFIFHFSKKVELEFVPYRDFHQKNVMQTELPETFLVFIFHFSTKVGLECSAYRDFHEIFCAPFKNLILCVLEIEDWCLFIRDLEFILQCCFLNNFLCQNAC